MIDPDFMVRPFEDLPLECGLDSLDVGYEVARENTARYNIGVYELGGISLNR